jgi:hypothetical protein
MFVPIDVQTKRYLFEYRHQGSDWSLELHACDLDDAKARLQTLPFASFQGEVVASGTFPATQPDRRNRSVADHEYHDSANDN